MTPAYFATLILGVIAAGALTVLAANVLTPGTLASGAGLGGAMVVGLALTLLLRRIWR